MRKVPIICKSEGCNKPCRDKHYRCSACEKRKFRKDNPLKSSYTTLRDNAKRRKKEFTITFEEFCKFAIETEYITKRGRTKTGYTIDREKEEHGYHIWNIRVLTNTENITKENNRRKMLVYNWEEKNAKFVEIKKPDTGEVPF